MSNLYKYATLITQINEMPKADENLTRMLSFIRKAPSFTLDKIFNKEVLNILTLAYGSYEYAIVPTNYTDAFIRVDLSDNICLRVSKVDLIKYGIELLDCMRESLEDEADELDLNGKKKTLLKALSLMGCGEAEHDQLEDKMIDLLGKEVWEVIKFNLEMCNYQLCFIDDNTFKLIDLEVDCEDKILTKLELLEYFIDSINHRIDSLPKSDRAPHIQDLTHLQEAIVCEKMEANRTRAINFKNHLKCKEVGTLLDEWLDMQNYTVYMDDFNQLYYIDEIKANKNNRSEYFQPTNLRALIEMVIRGIEEIMNDAKTSYSEAEIDYFYRKDIRIFQKYLAW